LLLLLLFNVDDAVSFVESFFLFLPSGVVVVVVVDGCCSTSDIFLFVNIFNIKFFQYSFWFSIDDWFCRETLPVLILMMSFCKKVHQKRTRKYSGLKKNIF
jgi:hypothetical protein